jgi:hypothetical protein
MLEAGEYGKARDLLEVFLLLGKVKQRFISIMQNYDPKQSVEIVARYVELCNFDYGLKNDPDGISILIPPELRQHVKALQQYINESLTPTADKSTVTPRNAGTRIDEMLKKRRETLSPPTVEGSTVTPRNTDNSVMEMLKKRQEELNRRTNK